MSKMFLSKSLLAGFSFKSENFDYQAKNLSVAVAVAMELAMVLSLAKICVLTLILTSHILFKAVNL